jgi:hypothetical protein
VELPPFPHNTAVTFRIRAEDSSGGERVTPGVGDPSGYHGYYVNDDQPDSPLPTFHLLVNHTSTANPLNFFQAMNCDTYTGGAFAYRGDLYPGLGIRQRGGSVCGSQKPYLKVRFNHGRDFQDRHKINLQSLWTDKSLAREHFAWDLFGEMQIPYCSTRYVRIHANGKYFGLYSELEHPDARFLRRNGLNPDGNLYKAFASTDQLMPDYRAGFEKKTNENGDFSDLKAFLDSMNTIPRTQLPAFWQKNVVPDSVIDYQASQMLTNNADYPHKNHYLYHDTADGRWRTLTWDMDLTFGKYWDGSNGGVLNDRMDTPGLNPWYTTQVNGGGGGNNLLNRFFFDTPDRYYQRAYRVRLWIALKEKYTPAVYDAKIAALKDLLMNEQAEDLKKWSRSSATPNDPGAPRDFLPNLERVRAHIRARQIFLLNYLQTTDRLAPPDRLKITEIMYRPSDDKQDLEFVELYNNSGKEIDVSGWTLEGVEYQFPPETKVSADAVVVIARSPDRFLARHGPEIPVLGPYAGELDDHGEELRLRDAGAGYPATIDVVRYRGDPPWPARSGDLGTSIELTDVTPDRDNDYGENWRASAFPGGSPGVIPGLVRSVPFRRGNCNGDERVTISDAVYLLGMFTRDFTPPRCLDGCDTNADRALDLTDVIVLLRYLFLNDDLIPSPGPRECKPTPGAFCEEANCRP